MPSSSSVLKIILGLTLPVYVPSLFSAVARGALFLVLPLYALELASGPFLAGLVLGVRGFSTMLVDIPAGLLVGRFGDRNVMLLSLFMLGATSVLGVLAPSAALLLVMGALIGAFSSSWILARIALLTELVDTPQRGRVVSIMAALERAGGLIGPVLAGFGIEIFGYEVVFLSIAACFVIPFVLCLIFTKTHAKHTERHVPIHLGIVIRRHIKIFVSGGSVMIILAILRSSRSLVIPAWGVAIGLSSSEIGIAISLAALIDTLMFLPAGFILDHVGRKAALIPCLILLGLSIGLLPLTESFMLFTLVVMLSGLGNGFGTGIFMTLGGDFSPRYGRNHFLGVWRFVGDSGQALGPTTLGYLANAIGTGFACLTTSLMVLPALLILCVFVPEPHPTKKLKSFTRKS